MKAFSSCLVIILSFCVCACSEHKGEAEKEIKRHEQSASAYLEQGQMHAAILEANKIIELVPQEPIGYLRLAKILNRIGAYGAVQVQLENKVAAMPVLATELALAYVGSKKYQSALDVLAAHPAKNAMELAQQDYIVVVAHSYLKNKAAYKSALEKFVTDGGAEHEQRLLKARYFELQEQDGEAQAIVAELLVQKPENIQAIVLQVRLFIKENALDVAEKKLSSALSLLPVTDIITAERAEVLSLLIEVLSKQGQADEAYVYHKALFAANPEANDAQQRLTDSIKLFKQDKLTEAETILNELRTQFPNDKNTGTLLGMVEYQKGNLENASKLFDEFLDPETTSASILQVATLLKFNRNQKDSAVAFLKDSTEKQPKNAAIWATYGFALLDIDNKSTLGAQALEKSLALDASLLRIRLVLARYYQAVGNSNQALAQLHQAYVLKPTDLVVQENYFKWLFSNNQAEKVKAEVDAFKEKYADSARAALIEARYFLEIKNYSAAELAFKRALATPNNLEKQLSFAGLATLYELQNQSQQAIAQWQQVISADALNTTAYSHLHKLMLALNKQEQWVAYLKDIENKNILVWQASVLLAQDYANKKQWKEAVEHIDLALARTKSEAHIKQIAANIYCQQGVDLKAKNQLSDARLALEKAATLSPNDIDTLANLVELSIAMQHLDEAQKQLNSFPQTDKNAHVYEGLQGLLRMAENKKEDGIAALLSSWKRKPTDLAASAIYDFYVSDKHGNEAEVFLEAWVQALPTSAKATLFKGMQAQNVGREDEAIHWYEKTLTLAPNMASALNNLAWLYYTRKDARSVSTAKKAYENAPTNSAVADTYGWILVEQGKIKQGVELLVRAIELDAGNGEAQEHLALAKTRQ
jgi:cellulose synthase operon protein C